MPRTLPTLDRHVGPTTTRSAPPTAGRRIAVLGAPPDTGNLGVDALGDALIAALRSLAPDAEVTLFDHGDEPRSAGSADRDREGGDLVLRRCGGHDSRRVWRAGSLRRAGLARRLPRRFPLASPPLEYLRRADIVLDASSGDSFTDAYGRRRFEAVTRAKRLVLDLGRPLVLLPQTYGPFRGAAARRAAASIVERSAMAWARDEHSLDALRGLLGAAFDPARHRGGVDLAFGLPATEPAPTRRCDALRAWLGASGRRVVINTSGLLCNDPDGAMRRFDLRANVGAALEDVVLSLLDEPGVHVLLLPHVVPAAAGIRSGGECDLTAARRLAASLGPGVLVAAPPATAATAKWIIARADWCCAGRMHATIAALSSGVPAAAIAYSHKAAGVFAGCAVPDDVADARRLDTAGLTDALLRSWRRRGDARRVLARTAPAHAERARLQVREIVAT